MELRSCFSNVEDIKTFSIFMAYLDKFRLVAALNAKIFLVFHL